MGFGGFSCLGALLYEGDTLFLGFYCIMGGSLYLGCLMGVSFECWVLLYYGGFFVSWVLDGGSIGFYFIMGVTLYLGCLLGGFFVSWVSCGFKCCGYVFSFGFS